ncbi:GlcNAc-PI de-N-acetylase [Pseudomonas agarici]|uniref:GlcNAc-PI de-N-acetylase n=1 Tax=Pseudomonas agarici TaxID=46677 RepID=A0A0X1T5R4_PSEAA|nr:PIG-L family deacetylase [Pseudomonas agarici]AMB87425.1 GlcNAc-PI de-N-acetylase [Pseudomonas agarici]NWB90896.1 PIG-L family deacetylase [Pseudomonas agarici]NWC11510.1 PIG-L family deacetylase [Pseudomonas agarici]SEK96920.1 N-acetylglucosaminyl deacetylase, LmbE family [Pseudomonas agarici]
MSRKQQLLRRHRRNKRIGLVLVLLLLMATGIWVDGWIVPLCAVLLWCAHEAWFADHLFYSPKANYHYRFPPDSERASVLLNGECLLLNTPISFDGSETLVLEVRVACSWLGRLIDPVIELLGGQRPDRQTFERGVKGVRYLNLSGQADALSGGALRLTGRRCRILGQPQLWVFRHPDYRRQRVMVIAPHADDAELAAFGLYSQADEAWIVTLTAGEIESEHYRKMGIEPAEASRLKGRLRAWDSIAVPQWAGVAPSRCIQLGYFCMQLPSMQATPDLPVPSLEANLRDTRLFRRFNPFLLPGDADGAPTWNRLLDDLRALLVKARPDVLVLPHPVLDPHPDHICSHAAVLEALEGLKWQPRVILGYANHLHDNDRWPMGRSGQGVALPPVLDSTAVLEPYSLELSTQCQLDKAMSLGMMHDLQPRPPFKRRLRGFLQRWLAGRVPSPYGENEYFRKAVRRHELFWRIKRP